MHVTGSTSWLVRMILMTGKDKDKDKDRDKDKDKDKSLSILHCMSVVVGLAGDDQLEFF